MIHSQDRSGYFGASDTAKIMGSWNTETFRKFWMEKMGLYRNEFCSIEMRAGTEYEHRILEKIGIRQMDRQIVLEDFKLRVNLDGEDEHTIYEVKTHKSPAFKVSSQYRQQAQVEMFAADKQLRIVAYRMTPEEYMNFFREIDPKRLTFHPIERDEAFIQRYLKRLQYLRDCLMAGRFPREEAI